MLKIQEMKNWELERWNVSLFEMGSRSGAWVRGGGSALWREQMESAWRGSGKQQTGKLLPFLTQCWVCWTRLCFRSPFVFYPAFKCGILLSFLCFEMAVCKLMVQEVEVVTCLWCRWWIVGVIVDFWLVAILGFDYSVKRGKPRFTWLHLDFCR